MRPRAFETFERHSASLRLRSRLSFSNLSPSSSSFWSIPGITAASLEGPSLGSGSSPASPSDASGAFSSSFSPNTSSSLNSRAATPSFLFLSRRSRSFLATFPRLCPAETSGRERQIRSRQTVRKILICPPGEGKPYPSRVPPCPLVAKATQCPKPSVFAARKRPEVLLDELPVVRRHLVRAREVELFFAYPLELAPEPVLELLQVGEHVLLELLEAEGVQEDLFLLELLHAADDLPEIRHVEVLTSELAPEVLGVFHPLAELPAELEDLLGRERARLIVGSVRRAGAQERLAASGVLRACGIGAPRLGSLLT